VIALPFFVLVLVLIFHVRREFLAAQVVSTRARTCAWVYASNGCDRVPPGCEGLVRTREGSASVGETLRNGVKGALAEGGNDSGVLARIVTKLVADALSRGFRRSADSSAELAITDPAILGGRARLVTARQSMACNLESQTPQEVLEDAADVLWHDL
jgi:hypothetical protein